MTSRAKMLLIAAIVAALALLGGAAVLAAGLSLPDQAADKASESTTEVSLPEANENAKVVDAQAPEGTPSPNAHAAFGQCVAANAKTAPDNVGSDSDWNPTDGCENTNRNAAANGRETAQENANENASTGLDNASSARANGESHRSSR